MPSFSAPQKRSSSSSPSPLKKQKMSLTQTYFLAHTARAKLSKEAARGDHNLRRLVGHANLLDGLMIDLVEAERSQEALFNSAAKQSQQSVTWAPEPTRQPTITEDYEEEDSEEEVEYDDQEMDDEEDDSLALVRTPSRSSPPELLHESDDESDDDSMPPSPPTEKLSFPPVSQKSQESIEESFYEDGYYLPSRPATVSVY